MLETNEFGVWLGVGLEVVERDDLLIEKRLILCSNSERNDVNGALLASLSGPSLYLEPTLLLTALEITKIFFTLLEYILISIFRNGRKGIIFRAAR